MNDITVTKALANVDALKAIGQTRIFLYRSDETAGLWPHVVSVRPGGSHRLDVPTSVRFTADHPSGLRFEWIFDIEPSSANGTDSYQIDVPGCRGVIAKLPAHARRLFRDYLAECAVKVAARGDEFQDAADRQHRDASSLRNLAEIATDAEAVA